jgi:transposase
MEKDARLARRIQGIYLAQTGRSCPAIMAITGAARRTIQQWVAKYNRGGLDGLLDKPRSGQPTKLPRDREEEFRRRLDQGPTPDDGVSALNGPAIQRILEREFGQIYTLWGVHDLLHRLGYSYLCPQPQHELADPIAQETFKKTSPSSWIRSKTSIPTRSSKSGSRTKPGSVSKGH